MDTFYILALNAPNRTLVLNSPVPYREGDKVTVLGGNITGTVVPSQLSNGSLQLTIAKNSIAADEMAWVFKISYKQ